MAGIKFTIDLDDTQAIQALKSLNAAVDQTEKNTTNKLKKADVAIGSFIGNLAAIGTIKSFEFLRAQVLQAFSTFSTFEKGLIDVAKTANLTEKEVEDLSKEVLKLNKVIPASTEELLDIATAAGQLGVKGTKNITLFTETVAKLGRVSNLQGDEAATVLTRILNVSNESIDSIDTFASVIVSLGNNFAATESEIAAVTNEIARATAQFGVGASESAALAATLRSVGVRAEEAGGVLSKTFVAINNSISSGGKSLEKLSELTGKSGEEIRKQFGENAIGFFRDFVNSLNNVEGGLASSNKVLESLGISGIRVQKVIPVLAQNIGEFDRALNLSNGEVRNAIALNEEFEKSLKSTTSNTQLLNNALERARIRIGDQLAGAFNKVAPLITEYVDKIGKSQLELFAENVDDVEKLNEVLEILRQRVKTVKENPLNLPEFLLADPKELETDIQRIVDKIALLNKESNAGALANLKTELKGLQDAIKSDDPILLGIFGGKDAAEKRANEVLEAIANAEKQAFTANLENIEENENAKTEKIKTKAVERANILAELKAVLDEEAKAKEAEDDLARQLKAETSLQFLENNLGKEFTLKELARIKDIESEKKRTAELKKLTEKARKNEEASLLLSINQQKKYGKERIAAQRQVLTDIAGLQSSSNQVLFAIGKAAALTQAYINTQNAVTNALANVPYPFNFAAAAAVGAAGAIRIANIASQKPPEKSAGSFQDGGIVGGNSFSGDRLQANVNSGEVIFNRRQQENLFRAVDSGQLGGGPSVTINNPVLLEQGAVDTLIDQINDAIEFRNRELRVG